jgi:hypothetical protein
VKLLRTIRFDNSDERVFEVAAQFEEWAVSGAFAFAHLAPAELTGKAKQGFANGFLGVESFGRSTFAVVAEAKSGTREEIEARLARHFVAHYGAPDIASALPAAREEVDVVVELCRDALINTVFTVRRTFDAAGQIREEFRTISPPMGEPRHARVWTVEPD